MSIGTGECVGNVVSEETATVACMWCDCHGAVIGTCIECSHGVVCMSVNSTGVLTLCNKLTAGDNVPVYESGTY